MLVAPSLQVWGDPDIGAILLAGDISYAQGFTYGWDQFWLNQQAHLSNIPWATTPGCASSVDRHAAACRGVI